MTLQLIFVIEIFKTVICKTRLFFQEADFFFSKQTNLKWKIYIFNTVNDPLTSSVTLQSLFL